MSVNGSGGFAAVGYGENVIGNDMCHPQAGYCGEPKLLDKISWLG